MGAARGRIADDGAAERNRTWLKWKRKKGKSAGAETIGRDGITAAEAARGQLEIAGVTEVLSEVLETEAETAGAISAGAEGFGRAVRDAARDHPRLSWTN
jgi:hypothetical protein